MAADDAPPPYTPTPSSSSDFYAVPRQPNSSSTIQPTCPPASSPLRDPFLDIKSYIPALRRYLRLLSHFRDLQAEVESYEGGDDRLGALSSAERWKLFLHLAVERLQLWISIFGSRGQLPWYTMPPDVGLVLCVWMTSSPGFFNEDVWRMHGTLLEEGEGDGEWLLRRRPKFRDVRKLVDSLGDKGPSQRAGQHEWEEKTRSPFEPLLAMNATKGVVRVCPRCEASVAVELTNPSKTGCAQAFAHSCPSCKLKLTHEVLGVDRLLQNLALPTRVMPGDEGPEPLTSLEAQYYLAGTLFVPQGTAEQQECARGSAWSLKQLVRLSVSSVGETGDRWGWSLDGARKGLAKGMASAGAKKETLDRILGAYTTGAPFSVDLVAAALRQSELIGKLDRLGWLCTSMFEKDETLLYLPAARYSGFLRLLRGSKPNDAFLTPTLDIDVVWLSRLIDPYFYHLETFVAVGHALDRSEEVDPSRISESHTSTSAAWEARFGAPYASSPNTAPSKGVFGRIRTLKKPSRDFSPEEQRLRLALAVAADAEGWAELAISGSSLAGATGGYKVGSTRWANPSRRSSPGGEDSD